MATTVSYKDQILTTITNNTKTLKTAGTWLEDDIKITDESSTTAVAVEDIPDEHGGIEKRITAIDISDTNATASDVAQGKVFYSNTGTRTVGTMVGAEWTTEGIATGTEPSGNIAFGNSVTTVKKYAFYEKPITGVSGQSVISIGDNAFYGSSITEVRKTDFPSLTSLDGSVFANSKQLQKVCIPVLSAIGSYVFDGCENLDVVVVPKAHTTGRYLCRNCYKLKAFDMRGDHTATTRINDHTFLNDSLFDTFIYGGNRLPLLDLSAFDGTPFASNGTGGKLYVRQDMVETFQNATNWSTLIAYPNNQILPIEGSYYETHYADGSEVTA